MSELLQIQYTYGFTPWPDRDCPLSPALQQLIRMTQYRHEEQMTEQEFGEFRIGLQVDGIDLHEIDRVPHYKSEVVL